MASSSHPAVIARPDTGAFVPQRQSFPGNEQQRQNKKKIAPGAGRIAMLRRPAPPTPLNELKGPAHLVASVLPDGFPPELSYRALAAYSLLRTLSWQLHLSPFTPNVFLRALALPCPNRLLGQIHVCILRILFPTLDLGYSYRENGGSVLKRKRIEEPDGVRVITVPLRASDNLTYLDGLSWPLFFDDYAHLKEYDLWSAMNGTELNVNLRNIALQIPKSNLVGESDEEDETETRQRENPIPAPVETFNESLSADVTIPGSTRSPARGRSGRGRGLPTQRNRAIHMSLAKQKAAGQRSRASLACDIDSETDSEYDDKDDDDYQTPKKRKSKGKRNSKSAKRQRSAGQGAVVTTTKSTPSPGSRVIEVSMEKKPGATISLPLPPASLMLQPNQKCSMLNSHLVPRGSAQGVPNLKPFSDIVSNGSSRAPFGARNATSSASNSSPSSSSFDLAGIARSNIFQTDVPWSHAQSSSTAAFPGSTVGSFTHQHAQGMLSRVHVEEDEPRTSLQHLQLPRRETSLSSSEVLSTSARQFTSKARLPTGLQKSAIHCTKQKHVSLHLNANQSHSKSKAHEVPCDVFDAIHGFMCGKSPTKPPDDKMKQMPSSQISQQLHRHPNHVEPIDLAKESAMPSEPRKGAEFSAMPLGDTPKQSSQNLLQFRQPANQDEPDNLVKRKVTIDSNGKVDGADSVDPAQSSEERCESDTWEHVKPIMQMRRGTPYHRLPEEQKLQILEFLLDELLSVDFIAAEFSRRHCVTNCYGTPYGTLPTDSELGMLENDDECRVCGQEGELLCCDGCTASYHRWCHNVTLGIELPEGTWLCADCKVADPSLLGPLRGGKKCAVDWFTLKDLKEASRLSSVACDPLTNTENAGNFTAKAKAPAKAPENVGQGAAVGSAVSLTAGVARLSNSPKGADVATAQIDEGGHAPHVKPVDSSSLRTEASREDFAGLNENESQNKMSHLEEGTQFSTRSLTHAPTTTTELDQLEFLVVHGFVFSRKQTESDTECSHDDNVPLSDLSTGPVPIPILTQSELNKFLTSIGQPASLSWPLVQIPNRVWELPSLSLRQKFGYSDYFSRRESYDPSQYMNHYYMAPIQRSKKHKCIGSQLSYLVHSEYENQCGSIGTQKLSTVLSRDMSSDSCLGKELRMGSELYDPYHLFTGYMLKLEGTLKRACLLNPYWGTRNSDCRSGIWSMNVARCQSVKRLALLLVKLVDAANSRVFLEDWHRLPGHSSAKRDVEPDSRTYLPLPADWTPDAELRKRKLERSSFAQFHKLLISQSTTLDGQVEGMHLDTKKWIASGRRKRKRTKPFAASVTFVPTLHVSKTEEEISGGQSSSDASEQCPTAHKGSPSTRIRKPIPLVLYKVPKTEIVKAVSPSQPATCPPKPSRGTSFLFDTSLSNKAAVVSAEKADTPSAVHGGEAVEKVKSTTSGVSVTLIHTSKEIPVVASCDPGMDFRHGTGISVESGQVTRNLEHNKCISAEKRSSVPVHDAPGQSLLVADDREVEKVVQDDQSVEMEQASHEVAESVVPRTGAANKRDKKANEGRRRSRRSGRLRDRDEFLGTLLMETGNAKSSKVADEGGYGKKGMESLIAAELSSKIRMLERLIRAPFDKEIHWPLAGRSLFEPVGCLPPAEMKRLARNAGALVAPYLTYNSSYEVGQAAVCHIWRKKVLQCTSFEELLLQIRILDSFMNKTVINAFESLGRKGSSSKSNIQKVIRCAQRDLETGTVHYFVVNKRKFRGCWIPEEFADLSSLRSWLVGRSEKALEGLAERKKLKLKDESKCLAMCAAGTSSKSISVQRSVPYAMPSAPGHIVSKHARLPANVTNKFSQPSSAVKTKKPIIQPAEKESIDTGVAVKKILQQHEVVTENLLSEAARLGLPSIPVQKMRAVRDNSMMLLKQATASGKEKGKRFEADAHLSERLILSEAAANVRFQNNMSQVHIQRTMGSQTQAVNGASHLGTERLYTKSCPSRELPVPSNTECQSGLPLLTGQNLQGYHYSIPGDNLIQPWEILQKQQRKPLPNQAHFGAGSKPQSFSHPDLGVGLGSSSLDGTQGQPGYFPPVYAHDFNGLSSVHAQSQGAFPKAAKQKGPAEMPGGVGHMTPPEAYFSVNVNPGFTNAFARAQASAAAPTPGHTRRKVVGRVSPSQAGFTPTVDTAFTNSMLRNSSGGEMGQAYGQYQQLMKSALEESNPSSSHSNFYGRSISANTGVQPNGGFDVKPPSAFFSSPHQQLEVNYKHNYGSAAAPSSTASNREGLGMAPKPASSLNQDYLSAMDFEPRPLEEMSKDSAAYR